MLFRSGVGVHVPGGQAAAVQVHAGDEHVVLHLVHQLDAQQAAVLIQVDVGGAAEGVSLLLRLQLGQVALAELNGVAKVLRVGAGVGQALIADALLLGQSGGDELGGAEHLLQTIVQAHLHTDGSHVNAPAVAGEALDLAVIADGGEEHLGEGVAGELAGGAEVAVAGAVDNA